MRKKKKKKKTNKHSSKVHFCWNLTILPWNVKFMLPSYSDHLFVVITPSRDFQAIAHLDRLVLISLWTIANTPHLPRYIRGTLLPVHPMASRNPTGSETKYLVINNMSILITAKPRRLTQSMYYDAYEKQNGTYCNYSYIISKPRDYKRTFTILLIPTTQLQMR